MRRRFIALSSFALSLLLVFSVFSSSVFCYEKLDAPVFEKTVFHPDGSRDEVILQVEPCGNRSIITGHITATHYSSSDELIWRVKLTGSFTYNGVVSNCTNAYTTINFYQSGWSVISENTTHNANVAATTVELGKNVLGIVYPMRTVNLSITCDKDGNLS